MATWAVFNWAATVRQIFDLYVVIPVWDYWRVPQHLKQIQSFDFRFLWSQHNEHRIIFPDIIFALDVLLFHGRRVLPLVASLLAYIGSGAVVGYVIAAEARISRQFRVTIILLVSIAIGWKGCALVLADPFLLQWTLMELAVLVSLELLTRTSRSARPWALTGAILSALIATYSSGNGLLLWSVLLMAGFLLRLSWRQMVVLAVSGLAADGVYFAGYHFSERTQLAELFLHPGYTICFIAAYLSMPFGGMKSPLFGVYVGLANLTIVLALFAIAVRHKALATRGGIVLFGSYLFTILSAILIAAGRMDATDFTFTSAKANRYLAPVMMNWGVFIALVLWTAALRRWRILSAPVLAAVIAGLLAIALPKLGWWLQIGERGFVAAQITELSMENGLHDPKLLRLIFPDPAFVEDNLPSLKKERLSIFYRDPGKWLGRPVSELGRPIPLQADGSVSRVLPRISGVEVMGWAGDRELPHFSRVLLVNEGGMIIGLGRRLPKGLPTELLSPGIPAQLAWIGFIPDRFARGSFSVRIVSRGGRELQQVRGSYEFPRAGA